MKHWLEKQEPKRSLIDEKKYPHLQWDSSASSCGSYEDFLISEFRIVDRFQREAL